MSFLLKNELPAFASELKGLLADEPTLSSQVDRLEIVDRCRCGDSFCSSMYTVSPPKGAWGDGHENVALEPEEGMVILDVLKGKIVMIEVLNRGDVHERLFKALP